jgi:putative ABC transport system ATP-binding protein
MLINAENLVKRVPLGSEVLTILDKVSFNIEQGESLAIIGVSGSGKTTLLGLLAGLDLPTEGRVVFDGVDLNALNENGRALIRAKNIGFVFQNFQLLPNLTALENVMLPLELNGNLKARAQGQKLLSKVGLKDRLKHYPRQLSGGEQQRVAIARAFAINPKILFADEPTGNLDQATANTVIELLFDLNQHFQTTLVCVTHDPLLGNRCKRSLHLAGGRLVQ